MLHSIARRALVVLALVSPAVGCGLIGERIDPAEDAKSQTTKTVLEFTEVQTGTGAEARSGRLIAVHYTGWLYHPDKPAHRGRQFDSSHTRGEPLEFTVDGTVPFAVIPGFNF